MTDLYPHQAEAIIRMESLERGGLLDIIMGGGKTRVALEFSSATKRSKILVLTPHAIIPSWVSESKLWSPHLWTIPITKGTNRQKCQQISQGMVDGRPTMVVVNYESAWRNNLGGIILKTPWDLILLDEVQKIKSGTTRQSKFCYRLARAHPGAFRIGLSGTPVPQGPLDAFGSFRCLDDRVFGRSFVEFRSRYARITEAPGFPLLLGYINLDEFNERYHSITYQAGEEVLPDLPKLVVLERTFELEPKARRAYNELRDDFVTLIGDGVLTSGHALVRLLRAQQITSGYVPVAVYEMVDDDVEVTTRMEQISTQKRKVFAEVLEEVGGEPLVVFCRFLQDLEAVHEACAKIGITSCELSGSRKELEDFQSDDGPQVIAVQLRSGSLGITLARASVCCFWSTSFSLSDHEQAIFRLRRIGQESDTVRVIYLIAEDTVDRMMLDSIATKKDLVQLCTERRTI